MPHAHNKLDIVNTGFGQPLGTLAAQTAIQLGTVPAITQNFQPALYQGSVGLQGRTAGDAPLMLVVADGGLTLAEVQEALTAEPLHSRDQPALDQARRPVRRLATLGDDPSVVHVNEGNRLPLFRENIGWEFYAFNAGTALTTGSTMSGQLATFGRWKD